MTADLVSVGLPSLDEYRTAKAVADAVARTPFVPDALAGKPESVLAAILAGRELGVGPMQSLSKIHVIKGKPSIAPELMMALVLRAGHRVDVVETTNDRCVVVGARRGSAQPLTVEWTMSDAQRAGLVKQGGGWTTYPRAMLRSRAVAELCRALFPDVLAGFSYVPEELGADVDEDGTPISFEAPPARDDTHGGSAGNAPPARTRDTPRAAGAASPRGAQPPAPAVTATTTATAATLDGQVVDVDLATGEVIDVPAVQPEPAQAEQASWDDLPPAKSEPELTSAALAVMAKGASLKWQTVVGIARGKAAAGGVPADQLPDLGPDSDDIHRLDDFPAFLPFLRDVIERQSE